MILLYSMKNPSEAGKTPNADRYGNVSAPAEVTTMESFRFWRMVRLNEPQKKIRPSAMSLRHKLYGSGSCFSMSLRLSAGICSARMFEVSSLRAHKPH